MVLRMNALLWRAMSVGRVGNGAEFLRLEFVEKAPYFLVVLNFSSVCKCAL